MKRVAEALAVGLAVFAIWVTSGVVFSRGQEKEKGGAVEKSILCLNQPSPCSELGRTRLMALYTKAMLLSAQMQQAQALAQGAAQAYNEEVKEVLSEEGQPKGTNYQIDLNLGTVTAVHPTPPATPPPTPPRDPTPQTSAPSPTKK